LDLVKQIQTNKRDSETISGRLLISSKLPETPKAFPAAAKKTLECKTHAFNFLSSFLARILLSFSSGFARVKEGSLHALLRMITGRVSAANITGL